MANAHSRSNLLTKVRVNGALLAEVDDTKDRHPRGAFLEEEVLDALNSLCGEKAPSSDGFTLAF
ncbi:hypothetical protein CK203_008595 [Vitis vinifera]|uniref:Uncharacterized protein n=1 Tax=Vitis vinifera TaxID=29760 RepID=A0A438KDF9_VITVI|nr:hypothetical protein CK203_008595 [Vitis vinifera]